MPLVILKRLGNLRNGSHEILKLLRLSSSNLANETQLLQRFRKHRIRGISVYD